jgi:hypothetical protein
MPRAFACRFEVEDLASLLSYSVKRKMRGAMFQAVALAIADTKGEPCRRKASR